MTVSVVIPWRDRGDERRRANLAATVDHLVGHGFTPHVVGDGRDGGLFNRSAAYNAGMREYPADVYVWHEADMIVPPSQLAEAIRLAAEAPGLVLPFTDYHMLNPEQGLAVHGGADPAPMQCNAIKGGTSIGAVGVTSAETMQLVGQWDEVFQGWGYDDNAMFHAFKVCAGAPRWVDGAGYHMWHPPGSGPHLPAESAATGLNAGRYHLYLAETNPRYIRMLTCQPGGAS